MSIPNNKISSTRAPIVFLVAKDRSGTTLLQTMLDSHPNICAPLESRFVLHYKQQYQNKKIWSQQDKKTFVENLNKEQKMALLWELNKEELQERLNHLPEKVDYGEICKQVYVSANSFHPKEMTKLIVDKNPLYALMLPFIHNIFPDARYIHLVRDYRANVNSVRSLFKGASLKKLAMGWTLANKEIEKWKEKYPEKFITLTYEELLTNPKEELGSLLEFLDLEFHPNMLTYHTRIAHAIAAYVERAPDTRTKRVREIGIATVHKNLSKPIVPSFKDKWKECLSEKEIKILDRYCGEFAKTYGYFPISDGQTKPAKIDLGLRLEREKLRLYYRLPIWLRELKSKPSMPFIPKI